MLAPIYVFLPHLLPIPKITEQRAKHKRKKNNKAKPKMNCKIGRATPGS